MKKIWLFLITMFAIPVFSQQSPPIWNLDPYNPEYADSTLLVKFEDESGAVSLSKANQTDVMNQIKALLDVDEIEQLMPHAKPPGLRFFKDYNGKEHQVKDLKTIYKIKYNNNRDAKELAEEISEIDGIEYAEPDYYFYTMETTSNSDGLDGPASGIRHPASVNKTSATPNDPLLSEQWYLDAFPGVNAKAAWDVTTGDTNQVIGIIDTGVDWDHPDLDDNIWRNWDEIPDNGIDDDGNGYVDDIRGWDFVNDDNDPNDDNSHGTHVAGIAAAEGNNGIGICGVAWNARIMPVKMLQSSGRGASSDLASSVNYAAQNGATVINMSMGSYGESFSVKISLENAYASALLVASAGNDGKNIEYKPKDYLFPVFPASYSYVIGVQATTQSSAKAGFSNYDPSGPIKSPYHENYNYEMKAPGVGIHSTFPNGGYNKLNGTSMSSPIVAASVALMKQHNPSQSAEQIYAKLIQSANGGILDLNNCIEYVLEPDLYFINYALIDTLPGCDRDGIADAGETVEIYLTVKNVGGQADSVWSKLRYGQFEDPSVATIDDSTSTLGDISAYATLTGEHDPVRVTIDPNTANNRDIVFEFNIGAKNHGIISGDLILTSYRGFELKGVLDSVLVLQSDNYWLVTESFRVGNTGKLIIKPGTSIDVLEGNYIDVRGQVIAIGTADSLITITSSSGPAAGFVRSQGYAVLDTFRYCNFVNIGNPLTGNYSNYIVEYCTIDDIYLDVNIYKQSFFSGVKEMTNCIIKNTNATSSMFLINGIEKMERNVVYNTVNWFAGYNLDNKTIKYNNFVNNTFDISHPNPSAQYSCIFYLTTNNNQFEGNNFIHNTHMIGTEGASDIVLLENQYWGSNQPSLVQENFYDFWDYPSIPLLDIEPMLELPSGLAHGIVWKVELNEIDPQDEYIDPIGIETVQFDVYFNRAMDTTYTPFLTFGVREPYTQHIVHKDASWSVDSTIWTAYYDVGLETGDGFNTVRVYGARDDEGFEIPIEDSRFQFVIQAAGAASNQFIASAGVGKVDLEWPGAESEDILGYNMYRYYNLTDTTFSDTTLINAALITDTLYTDADVIPDTTYHYLYKVLGTDMAESDFSKFVVATPVNAASGDANGDLAVNVTDIVTIVSYILENDPAPFLFEAADVNSDGSVNVLDVVGTVNLIMGVPKQLAAKSSVNENVNLSLYQDKLILETDRTLAGLQFKITGKEAEALELKSKLEGFEMAKSEVEGQTVCVLYSLSKNNIKPGKHVLFEFEGNETLQIESAFAATPGGSGVTLKVDNRADMVIPEKFELEQNYPNPFNPETTIRFGLPEASPVKISVFNILGQKVWSYEKVMQEAGFHTIQWQSVNDRGIRCSSGVYIYRIEAGEFVKSRKMLLIR